MVRRARMPAALNQSFQLVFVFICDSSFFRFYPILCVSFQIGDAVVGHPHPLVHQRHALLQCVGALHQIVVLADLLLQLLQPVGDRAVLLRLAR